MVLQMSLAGIMVSRLIISYTIYVYYYRVIKKNGIAFIINMQGKLILKLFSIGPQTNQQTNKLKTTARV